MRESSLVGSEINHFKRQGKVENLIRAKQKADINLIEASRKLLDPFRQENEDRQ